MRLFSLSFDEGQRHALRATAVVGRLVNREVVIVYGYGYGQFMDVVLYQIIRIKCARSLSPLTAIDLRAVRAANALAALGACERAHKTRRGRQESGREDRVGAHTYSVRARLTSGGPKRTRRMNVLSRAGRTECKPNNTRCMNILILREPILIVVEVERGLGAACF